MDKCESNIAKYVLKVARLKENEISNWIKIVKRKKIAQRDLKEMKREKSKRNRFKDVLVFDVYLL